MDIKELLKESTKDVLSEENLQKIVEAVESKASSIAEEKHKVKLESALAKQDAVYADKLQTLLEDIDEKHTGMMVKLMEAMENKHVGLLNKLIKKYKTDYVTESKNFKENLVNKIDKFFDLVIEENIPTQQLNEAVENTRYKKLIEQIGHMIGVSNIQENQLVREGLLDAKEQMDSFKEQIKTLKKENEKLITEQSKIKSEKLLVEKCVGLPKVKKDYIMKMLGNKTEEFITENFDYTLELFDEEDNRKTERIKKEAKNKSKVILENVDRPELPINEKVEDEGYGNFYMEELSKY